MDKQKGRKSWSDETLLARALSVKTAKAYWNTISELRQRASASLWERCVELTASRIPEERSVGVDILSQLYRIDTKKKYGRYFPYRKESIALFFKMLSLEENADVVISLLYGIGHNNAYTKSKDINTLIPFTRSEDKNIRFAAGSALSGIENMKAIKGLIALSEDTSSHIRDWATFAIGTQSDLDNETIRSALYARCTDRHHDTRMEAIYGLAKRKDSRVKEYLEKEFEDCTVYVLESIQALHATEYLPRLETLLEETENNPDTDQYWLSHLQECLETLRGGQQNA